MAKPDAAKKSLDYAPATKAAERRPRTPGGFAGGGSDPAEAVPGKPGAKKRRIVVRKKPSASKD
jgi:hypothetical protein